MVEQARSPAFGRTPEQAKFTPNLYSGQTEGSFLVRFHNAVVEGFTTPKE